MAGGSPGNFSTRLTKTPPDKGSFPIDHEGACKHHMVEFLKCLRTHKFDNEKCRNFSKDYLECRMQHGLMARDDWKNLGYSEAETVGGGGGGGGLSKPTSATR